MTAPGDSAAAAWLAAAIDDRIAAELEAIYLYVAAALESRGPACWASGRCCNFETAGHRLYTTGLEAAYTVSRLGTGTSTAAPFTSETLAAAIARGGCPFQVSNLCGVHTIKPLGCRVYFCDRSAQGWQQELSESMQTRIRALHDRHGVEYVYDEWRRLLARFGGA